MAKKIRFPLQMNGTDVRTIEELREHFDLESVLGYYINGKLVTWLRDRYYDEIATAIEVLSSDDTELNQKIMSILGVIASEMSKDIDIHELRRRIEKISLLRQLTDDEELINKIDSIAFNQDDLTYIQKKGIKEIYLCKGEFEISLEQTDITYTKIFNPTVSVVGEDVQYQMGMQYYQGDGVEKDYKKAFESLSKAADTGNVKALVQLGICYYYGRGTALNYSRAIECFKKAIKSEDEDAYFWLGKCYLYGYVPDIVCCFHYNVDVDYSYNLLLAYYCFCKSRYNDITKWYMFLCYGVDYMNNFGRVGTLTPENSNWMSWDGNNRTSYERIKKEIDEINVEQMLIDLIEAGDIDAEFELGRLYFYGNRESRGVGIGYNKEEAKRLINHSIENNQSAAQYWISCGRSPLFWDKSVVVDWLSQNEKSEWCKQSYLNGCIYAASYLGLADFTGYHELYSLLRDEEARYLIDWFRQLANDENRYAQFVVARYLRSPNDTYKGEAFQWLVKSAENGYAVAQKILGGHYKTQKDSNNFIYWSMKAVEQDYSLAAFNLGIEYNGDAYSIFPKNREKQIEYFTIGAELGEKHSISLLEHYGIKEFKRKNKSKMYFQEHLGIDLDSITIN